MESISCISTVCLYQKEKRIKERKWKENEVEREIICVMVSDFQGGDRREKRKMNKE